MGSHQDSGLSATSRARDFTSFANIVNGQRVESGKASHGIDPATKKPLWPVPLADESVLNGAVAAAEQAFRKWSKTSLETRRAVIARMRERLAEFRPDMANLLMKEIGRPPFFADLEVQHALACLDAYSDMKHPADRLIEEDDEKRVSLRYYPLGVFAGISPWNYPLILCMNKIASAIFTGNTIIVKPSPFAPYSVPKFVELVQDLLPPGVVQALNGDDQLGPLMCIHPGISKISFTGSVATGKKVMAAASATLKGVSLEMSGNDPAVICPDVDVAVVAPEVALGVYFNSGQMCVATKRIYVHEDIYQDFLKAFSDVVRSYKVGPSSMPDVMLGPIQNKMQYEKVKAFYADTAKNGYKFAVGDGNVQDSEGYFVQPAVVDNPPDDSMVVAEEPFGPIVPLLKWSDEDDLMKRVNKSNTGLGGSVWSSNVDYAQKLADQMEVGAVWINSFPKPLPRAYFGGIKDSGVEGEWGEEGLVHCCNIKITHFYKMDPKKKSE